MKTIRTTDELLALRNVDGAIDIDDDCLIECDVPWGECAKHIAAIHVRGNLDVRGSLFVRGELDVRGDAAMRGDLYWSHASPPAIRGRWFHRRILPLPWQRAHWAERLGVELDGCYEEIIEELDIDALLAETKWSRLERLILESAHTDIVPVPAWVTEMEARNKAAGQASAVCEQQPQTDVTPEPPAQGGE